MRVAKNAFRIGMTALSLAAIFFIGEATLAPAHGQFGGYGGWFSPFQGYGSGYRYPSYRRDRVWHRPRPRARKPAPPPPVNVNAPPAQKHEQPPKEVAIVIGDSLAEWLAYGLEQNLDEDESDTRDIGVVRKIRSNAGLIDNCRGDLRKWLQDSLALDKAQKPAFVAVMMGFSDRKPIKDCAEADSGSRASGRGDDAPDSKQKSADGNDKQKNADGNHEFRTDEWTARYGKRIDEALAVLKSKGVPVLWVGLPAMRGVREADIGILNDLYRERAAKAGVRFVDVWDGFVDDNGDFSMRGPDVNGQVRVMRAADGTHFSKAGARKLAHYLEQEFKRASVTIQEPPQAKTAPAPAPDKSAARPVAGPVVPLNSDVKADELAGNRAPQAPDSSAARFFRDGVAPAPPRGRADDFAWPRTSGPTELLGGEPQEAQEAASPPPAAAPKIPVRASGYAKGERRRR